MPTLLDCHVRSLFQFASSSYPSPIPPHPTCRQKSRPVQTPCRRPGVAGITLIGTHKVNPTPRVSRDISEGRGLASDRQQRDDTRHATWLGPPGGRHPYGGSASKQDVNAIHGHHTAFLVFLPCSPRPRGTAWWGLDEVSPLYVCLYVCWFWLMVPPEEQDFLEKRGSEAEGSSDGVPVVPLPALFRPLQLATAHTEHRLIELVATYSGNIVDTLLLLATGNCSTMAAFLTMLKRKIKPMPQ